MSAAAPAPEPNEPTPDRPPPLDGQPDDELVRRAQAGVLEAYDELVRRYQVRLYTTLYNMTANHEDANDLTQETLIRGYQMLHTFKGDSSFYTWIYRIAVNKTLNFLKVRNRRPVMSLNELDISVESHPEIYALVSDKNPRRDLAMSEFQERLNEALQKLSEPHRMVVVLHDIQGVPHEDIARIMDTNIGTVRSRLFYAHQQLQGLLANYLS